MDTRTGILSFIQCGNNNPHPVLTLQVPLFAYDLDSAKEAAKNIWGNDLHFITWQIQGVSECTWLNV